MVAKNETVALVIPSWNGVTGECYAAHMLLAAEMGANLGPGRFIFCHEPRKPTPFACQDLFESALAGGAEWILFLDDDCLPPPNVYPRLRRHADPATRPIVSALGFFRAPPYWPSIFRYERWSTIPEASLGKPYPICEYPQNQLIRVDGTGFCCLLIHRSVLERLKRPWFDQRDNYSPDGYFMEKCWKANIPIHCHTGVEVAHEFQGKATGESFRRWCDLNGGIEAAKREAIQHFRLVKTFVEPTGEGQSFTPAEGEKPTDYLERVRKEISRGGGRSNHYELLSS